MLGPSLLVAPVFSPDGAVSFYLPRGRWTNFFTGEVAEGPRWMDESHGCLSLPLWVRPGTLLAIGRQGERPDYDYADGVVLQAYEIPDGEKIVAVVPSAGGKTETVFEVAREGRKITARRNGSAKAWKLLLAGWKEVSSIQGGKAEEHSLGTQIAAIGNRDSLTCELNDQGGQSPNRKEPY
jgi:alpha-D-xyloside xylohydrolase